MIFFPPSEVFNCTVQREGRWIGMGGGKAAILRKTQNGGYLFFMSSLFCMAAFCHAQVFLDNPIRMHAFWFYKIPKKTNPTFLKTTIIWIRPTWLWVIKGPIKKIDIMNMEGETNVLSSLAFNYWNYICRIWARKRQIGFRKVSRRFGSSQSKITPEQQKR